MRIRRALVGAGEVAEERARVRIPWRALHVVLSLALGGLIYVLWRPRTLLLFRCCDALGLGRAVDALRGSACGLEQSFPAWTFYSLPHALWLYAFTIAVGAIWTGARGVARTAWLAVPPVLGIGSEVGQAIDLVPGTFEWADIVACVAATLLAFAVLGGRGRRCGLRVVGDA